MKAPLHADPLPLRIEDDGTIRVGQSRVTLDVLLADYRNGKSPEEIVLELDTLSLADIHGSIAYYFRHRDEVDEYLRRRNEEANALRRKIEERQLKHPSRVELLARLAKRGFKLHDI